MLSRGTQKKSFRMRISKWKVRDTGKVVHNVLRKVEIKVISRGTRVQYTEWGT